MGGHAERAQEAGHDPPGVTPSRSAAPCATRPRSPSARPPSSAPGAGRRPGGPDRQVSARRLLRQRGSPGLVQRRWRWRPPPAPGAGAGAPRAEFQARQSEARTLSSRPRMAPAWTTALAEAPSRTACTGRFYHRGAKPALRLIDHWGPRSGGAWGRARSGILEARGDFRAVAGPGLGCYYGWCWPCSWGPAGRERGAERHAAGLRTHILVTLGRPRTPSPVRSASPAWAPRRTGAGRAQIVTGVGFLGAGTIWRNSQPGGGGHLRPDHGGQHLGRRAVGMACASASTSWAPPAPCWAFSSCAQTISSTASCAPGPAAHLRPGARAPSAGGACRGQAGLTSRGARRAGAGRAADGRGRPRRSRTEARDEHLT